MNTNTALLPVAEAQVKSLIESVGPRTFVTAINNACSHGKIFENMGIDVSENALDQFYAGVDKMIFATAQFDK